MEETDGGGSKEVRVAPLLPPGFRFYPTEEELVSFYLKNKINGNRIHGIDRVIPQINVYDFNPWDLPELAGEFCRADPEQWFFYIPRQKKEASGGRPSRLTNLGYWKSTGSPSVVYSLDSQSIGMKKTMVFYYGRAATGKKTKWLMNEYKVFKDDHISLKTSQKSELMQEVSLCRIYIKSKGLRAFDRRPTGIAIRESAGQIDQKTSDNDDDHRGISPSNHRELNESTMNASYDHTTPQSQPISLYKRRLMVGK